MSDVDDSIVPMVIILSICLLIFLPVLYFIPMFQEERVIIVSDGYFNSYWYYTIVDNIGNRYALHQYTMQTYENKILWTQMETGLEIGKKYHIYIGKNIFGKYLSMRRTYGPPLPEIIKFKKMS